MTGDFDGDGRTDLVTVPGDATSLSLFFGNRDGSFSPPTTLPLPFALFQTYYVPAAVGDVDGDGRADLVVFTQDDESYSASTGEIDTYLGHADRAIVAQRTPMPEPLFFWTNLALGDLDGDGRPDVVVAGASVQILSGHGDGTFGPPVRFADSGGSPDIPTIGDLNGDGRADLLLQSFATDDLQIFVGDCHGGLQPGDSYVVGATRIVIAPLRRGHAPDLLLVDQGTLYRVNNTTY